MATTTFKTIDNENENLDDFRMSMPDYVVGNIDNSNPLHAIFAKIDTDRSGTLNRSEIRELFTNRMNEMGNVDMINEEEIELLLDRIDTDGDGEIDYQEFIQAFNGVESMEELIDTSYLHVLFSRVDKDNSDTIDHDEILQLFANAEDMAESDKHKILSLVDSDGDGTISFREFKNAFRSMGCKSENDLIEKSYLRIVFTKIDDNKNKKLELEEWRKLFWEQNITLTEKELYRLIEGLDEDGDGAIDFYEFQKAFKKVCIMILTVNRSALAKNHCIITNFATNLYLKV